MRTLHTVLMSRNKGISGTWVSSYCLGARKLATKYRNCTDLQMHWARVWSGAHGMVSSQLYCFRARVNFYCYYIMFSANTVHPLWLAYYSTIKIRILRFEWLGLSSVVVLRSARNLNDPDSNLHPGALLINLVFFSLLQK